MINLLVGRPGSGKSYESVTFHILPALKEGRKVITNLPLNLEYIFQFFPEYKELIEIREHSKVDKVKPAFSHIDDYDLGDWRNEKNQGPLLVIDECHKALPRGKGAEGTPRIIEEWYAEHRHFGVDVILITQAYAKISKSIVDMIQVMYTLSNARSFGSPKTYIQKTYDGVKGAVLSTRIRKYDKKNYKFYKSHTKSSGSVAEATASDTKALWKDWRILGFAIVSIFLVYRIVTTPLEIVPESNKKEFEKKQEVQKEVSTASVAEHKPELKSVPQSSVPGLNNDVVKHPFMSVALHVSGYVSGTFNDIPKEIYQLVASKDGQPSFEVTMHDLILAGYALIPRGSCALELKWGDYSGFVTCDSPRINHEQTPPGRGLDLTNDSVVTDQKTSKTNDMVVIHKSSSDFDFRTVE